MIQRPTNLESNYNGIAPEDYKDMPLPEDYEITEVLSNVIVAEYVDVEENDSRKVEEENETFEFVEFRRAELLLELIVER